MQNSIEDALGEGKLELDKWAQLMLTRIRENFSVQKIWPEGMGSGGPYPRYALINAYRTSKGWGSTGEAYSSQALYAKVHAGAGGNTVKIDFFFRKYLLFVDWGAGRGMKARQAPKHGDKPKMKQRYGNWTTIGDRQQRPVILGTLRTTQFSLGRLLEQYWGEKVLYSVNHAFGFTDEKGNFIQQAEEDKDLVKLLKANL